MHAPTPPPLISSPLFKFINISRDINVILQPRFIKGHYIMTVSSDGKKQTIKDQSRTLAGSL